MSSINQNFVVFRVAGWPHAKIPIKPRVWPSATKSRPHKKPHLRFLGVWPCGLCGSPLRGSVRRATRAASTLLPWGRA